jgi:hypothetical protein
VYEQHLTIVDRQLAALRVFDLNLPALNFSTSNATIILDKLTSLTERLLKRNARAGIFKTLASHYIRFHLEEGICSLLTKIDKNLTAMQISDNEAYNEHRSELVNIGMELVKASPPLMSPPIDHLNTLISKHCQDRDGLIDILMYSDELRIIGKSLVFVERNQVEEVDKPQQPTQPVHTEEDSNEQAFMLREVDDAGFGIDGTYLKSTPSYSFIADISDTENPF